MSKRRGGCRVGNAGLCVEDHSHHAQEGARLQPQATAEDVLAALVHHSAVIFAGEVYAIRMPVEMKAGTDVSGGLPSSRADAVQVEFRVDVGIRGASIGSNYVLHMPWRLGSKGRPLGCTSEPLYFFGSRMAPGFQAR